MIQNAPEIPFAWQKIHFFWIVMENCICCALIGQKLLARDQMMHYWCCQCFFKRMLKLFILLNFWNCVGGIHMRGCFNIKIVKRIKLIMLIIFVYETKGIDSTHAIFNPVKSIFWSNLLKIFPKLPGTSHSRFRPRKSLKNDLQSENSRARRRFGYHSQWFPMRIQLNY